MRRRRRAHAIERRAVIDWDHLRHASAWVAAHAGPRQPVV
jgi:hypothetical protein